MQPKSAEGADMNHPDPLGIIAALQKDLRETKDRCRRMETKLVKFLESQGFDAGTKMPSYRGGAVYVPSADCSLRAILETVKEAGHTLPSVQVYLGERLLAAIILPET